MSASFSKQSVLPKIEIPHFGGDLTEWHNFYDTFKSFIHDNDELPAVQKFQFLRTSLVGEASSVVDSLHTSEENYIVACGHSCKGGTINRVKLFKLI